MRSGGGAEKVEGSSTAPEKKYNVHLLLEHFTFTEALAMLWSEETVS